jgi:hypothetical protein
VLVDLDDDGRMEVVLPSLSGGLMVLNGVDGEMRALYNCGGRIWATPIVCDANRDRVKEILIGTEAGELFALQVTDSGAGFFRIRRSTWTAVHHDMQNTGHGRYRFSIFSIIPWM